MIMIGPFAQAEAQYRQSRLVSQEIESYRRTRRARRVAASRRRGRWRALLAASRTTPGVSAT